MTLAIPLGRLDGAGVTVPDPQDARRLAKAGVGTTAGNAGGMLGLTFAEAAWAVNEGRLQVQDGRGAPMALAQLLAAAAGNAGTGGVAPDVGFLVYSDLRKRGLTVRAAPPSAAESGFRVERPTGAAGYDVLPCAVRDPLPPRGLVRAAQDGRVFAVVDDDSRLRHYRAAFEEPRGEVAQGALPHASGRAVGDRVVVDDAAAAAAYAAQGIGQPVGAAVMLSRVEAEALRRSGHVALDAPTAASLDVGLAPVVQVYADLRARGVAAKSGFYFGTHLRGYRGAPDDEHAEWLVHCAGPGPLGWNDIARGVRLALGVRKKFLVAVEHEGAVRYVHVAWFRPGA